MMPGPLHAYLAGRAPDHRGRSVGEVLAFTDEEAEAAHDYIQWLFPLPTRSRAQPGAPVLTEGEADAIRADPQALVNLGRAAERMLAFYRNTDHWLAAQDHNHLRITRIISSLRLLAGAEAARRFHDRILALHVAGGSPVNGRSLAFWENAARG
jgi:Opioid growth factor receptor (OGFr) conserved region